MHTPLSTTAPGSVSGASYDAFAAHPGYRRMFAPGELTLGIFLPLRFFQGNMQVLEGQADLVAQIDRHGFAAVWVRDVPLLDPNFGDAGQIFDPFTYLSYLAGKTTRIALASGSVIFSLRHPIDLAKMATTVDHLSGGRLVLGIATGDRPIEFPAYGIDFDSRGQRFAETVAWFRHLTERKHPSLSSTLGTLQNADFLPKAAVGRIPLIITGASQQNLSWIAENADGWLTYPQATHTPAGPRKLANRIREWRHQIADGGFRPHMTNDWLDLDADPDFPRTPQHGGFILKTGRKGLIALLEEWRDAGVNHAALGIQFSQRPAAEVIHELAQEVLPLFPSHAGPEPLATRW